MDSGTSALPPRPDPLAAGRPRFDSDASGRSAESERSTTSSLSKPDGPPHTAVTNPQKGPLSSLVTSIKNSSVGLFARSVASNIGFRATTTFDPGTEGSLIALAKDKLGILSGSETRFRTLQKKAEFLRKELESKPEHQEELGKLREATDSETESDEKQLASKADELAAKRSDLAQAQKELRAASNEKNTAQRRLDKANKNLASANEVVQSFGKNLTEVQQKEKDKADTALAAATKEQKEASEALKEKTEAKAEAKQTFTRLTGEEAVSKGQFDRKADEYEKIIKDVSVKTKIDVRTEPEKFADKLSSMGTHVGRAATGAGDLVDQLREKRTLSNYLSRIDSDSDKERQEIGKRFGDFADRFDNAADIEKEMKAALKAQSNDLAAKKKEAMDAFQAVQDARKELREAEKSGGMSYEEAVKMRATGGALSGVPDGSWNSKVPVALQKAIDKYEEALGAFHELTKTPLSKQPSETTLAPPPRVYNDDDESASASDYGL